MKGFVNFCRFVTGALFVFSGLVKAIDPRGLAYKMQEFFEAWASDGVLPDLMSNLNEHALGFSICMISLEIVAGVALLIGWQKKITTWILFLLILFFTFLTGYVLFSGKIRTCGCFGDCIPLTAIQTFTKDIILLFMGGILLLNIKKISILAKPFMSLLIILGALIGSVCLQFYVLRHLPLIDCLPYKVGNNIAELRKMPADAVQDTYDYLFTYSKNGVKKSFPMTALPDSTWTFVSREEILLKKGKNNTPVINDFSLTNPAGENITEKLLSGTSSYYLIFIKEIPEMKNDWQTGIGKFLEGCKQKKIPCYIVTSTKEALNQFVLKNRWSVEAILTSDATAIKTAARVNPTIYFMKGPVVMGKWSWANVADIE